MVLILWNKKLDHTYYDCNTPSVPREQNFKPLKTLQLCQTLKKCEERKRSSYEANVYADSKRFVPEVLGPSEAASMQWRISRLRIRIYLYINLKTVLLFTNCFVNVVAESCFDQRRYHHNNLALWLLDIHLRLDLVHHTEHLFCSHTRRCRYSSLDRCWSTVMIINRLFQWHDVPCVFAMWHLLTDFNIYFWFLKR